MPLIILYFLKLSVSLAAVFLFYHFILRRLTFYTTNRWFLLLYSCLAVVLPLVNISPVLDHPYVDEQMINWVPAIHQETIAAPAGSASNFFSWWQVLLVFMFAGMLFLLIRVVQQLFSFLQLKRKARADRTDGILIYQVDEPIVPFSFGNSIYVNRQLHGEEEISEIIQHEFVHVKQRHSLDILWAELLCIINWYNPFAWLLKKSIRQNLEFIADREVLKKGFNKKDYQYLLLKVTGNYPYRLTPSFNFLSLKQRIIMMNKTQTAQRQSARLLFLLPATVLLLLAFRNQPNQPEMVGQAFSLPLNPVLLTSSSAGASPLTAGPVQRTDTVPSRGAKKTGSSAGSVQRIEFDNLTVKVWSVNGNYKVYDIADSAQKRSFEKQYGKIPTAPIPPPPAYPATGKHDYPGYYVHESAPMKTAAGNYPPPSGASNSYTVAASGYTASRPVSAPQPILMKAPIKKMETKHALITLWLDNGQQEIYDLRIKDELNEFNRKYGKFITASIVEHADKSTSVTISNAADRAAPTHSGPAGDQ